MLQKRVTIAMLLLSLSLSLAAVAGEVNDLGARQGQAADVDAAEGRLIVTFRAPSSAAGIKTIASADRVRNLGERTRVRLTTMRAINGAVHLVQVDRASQSLEAVAAQLRSDPEVAAVSLDRRRYAHAVPNDTRFSEQWYLRAANPASTNAESAWDVSTGSSGVVIAVLDSGVRFEHPDLGRAAAGGRLLPG